jgi:hypothetical protein
MLKSFVFILKALVCSFQSFVSVHAKTVKNTENKDGQKNEIQRKNNYSRPKFGTKKKLYFENTGTEGSVFYCIFSNTTGKYLYWHAQLCLILLFTTSKLFFCALMPPKAYCHHESYPPASQPTSASP